MKFELFIALRYLKAKKKTGFISLITYISIGGVMLGVSALIFILSMLNGFEQEVRSRMLGFDAHMKIEKLTTSRFIFDKELENKIRNIPGIVGISSYVLQKAVVSGKQGQSVVFVKGIRVPDFFEVTDLDENIIEGDMNIEGNSLMLPGVVIGRSLFERWPVMLQDTISVISPLSMASMFDQPSIRRFQMKGIFQTDLEEYDDAYVFVPIEAAQKLFNMGLGISGVDVMTSDFENTESIAINVAKTLGEDYRILTWYDLHRDLFSAMKTEKRAALIILSLIITVAAFNIISSLIMVVMEKTKEIGILKSIGVTSKSIMRIFMLEGMIVGFVGIVLGVFLGYGTCWLQTSYNFIKLPASIFIIDTLPIIMKSTDFFNVIIAALVLCTLATLYPAWKAASLIPVDALKS